MEKYDYLRHKAQIYQASYPPGTRIELLSMENDPQPIEPGMRGTVVAVDDMGTVHCEFDNGRNLGVIPGVDSFRTLTEEEQTAEKQEAENIPVMGR